MCDVCANESEISEAGLLGRIQECSCLKNSTWSKQFIRSRVKVEATVMTHRSSGFGTYIPRAQAHPTQEPVSSRL